MNDPCYYRLEFPDRIVPVNSLIIDLGRSHPSPPSNHIDIGSTKLLSRHHLTIQWNSLSAVFELQILGKNGVTVDSEYYKVGYSNTGIDNNNSNTTVPPIKLPMNRSCAICVGEIKFYFNPAKRE